ncbi:pyridoxamine 5'-phosphate oxidase family protein [Archangium violaceum]|uniref:pyridoxamine 5'-phosphate oxidase family protein n=1 Tax=Archangium violaceum TaxID=83451 RepID=UPI00193B2F2D|nr:pyridoxamine 5'-phosphate oxidase family protein [Archangium violaceum]QRK09303.1 pyridoxamine 5'-phosphate oxidase family protein [Archangium violaceum]
MENTLGSISELEACLGTTPLGVQMKVIDHLDAHAARWIAASPFAFVAFSDASSIRATLAGGAPGFASVQGPQALVLPAEALEDATLARAGQGVGMLFLLSGIGETLRVNGRVSKMTGAGVELAVDECYVHCAKALLRSQFWAARPRPDAPTDVAAFLAETRFLALATADANGNADLSPKGDPAGKMVREQDGKTIYADRPGNRRADSFRNILVRPEVAALALVPGSPFVAALSGRARIVTDEGARAPFAVDGKTPLLATVLEGPPPVVFESAVLQRARLWPSKPAEPGIDPSEILLAHVKLNKTLGQQATELRTSVSRDIIGKGLEADYRDNLY